MDDVIYEEFKGTGNMEIHMDRRMAEKRVYRRSASAARAPAAKSCLMACCKNVDPAQAVLEMDEIGRWKSCRSTCARRRTTEILRRDDPGAIAGASICDAAALAAWRRCGRRPKSPTVSL